MSVSFRWLPADIWLGCILPHLDARDVLALVALNSETRLFFTTGRLAATLKELGFSDYQTSNEWTMFLLSLGVFLSELDVQSRVYSGLRPGRADRLEDSVMVVNNQTSLSVTSSLKRAASHPGVAVRHLSLFTPYLAGYGLRFVEVRHQAPGGSFSYLRERMIAPVSNEPFQPLFPWKELLWPSLTSLRLTGPWGDAGPVFSDASLQELGQAVPNLTLLELQGLPRVIDVGSWFPRLETFVVQGEVCRGQDFDRPQGIKGSATLQTLKLFRCNVEGVAVLVGTSPNLVVVDLGWNARPARRDAKVPPTVLPRSVAHFVTNGSLLDVILVEHQLQSLEVFNCHLSPTLDRLVQLSNCSIRATLHRVPRQAAFGNHVTAFFVSELGHPPEGFVRNNDAVNQPYGVWIQPQDGIDHSHVKTGVLHKTLPCPACSRLIDETCVADHQLMCERRKRECPMCHSKYETRGELERHKQACPHFVVPCQLCFKTVPRSQWSAHYQRDHNDRREKVNLADCPNSEAGCKFFGLEQNSAERERHLRLCGSGTLKCMSCEQDVPCLAALRRHACQGPRFVQVMLVSTRCTPLFPNDPETPLERLPIEGKHWSSWRCASCETENIVTHETLFHLRFHCRKCLRVPKLHLN